MNPQPTTLNASERAHPMASWCFHRLPARPHQRQAAAVRVGALESSGPDRGRRPPTPRPASVVGLPRTDARCTLHGALGRRWTASRACCA
jgi:hypothetical protein